MVRFRFSLGIVSVTPKNVRSVCVNQPNRLTVHSISYWYNMENIPNWLEDDKSCSEKIYAYEPSFFSFIWRLSILCTFLNARNK